MTVDARVLVRVPTSRPRGSNEDPSPLFLGEVTHPQVKIGTGGGAASHH
jgi:hypothetical protein